jgi:hypothetical protein
MTKSKHQCAKYINALRMPYVINVSLSLSLPMRALPLSITSLSLPLCALAIASELVRNPSQFYHATNAKDTSALRMHAPAPTHTRAFASVSRYLRDEFSAVEYHTVYFIVRALLMSPGMVN